MKRISLFILAFLLPASLFSGGPAVAPRDDDETAQESRYSEPESSHANEPCHQCQESTLCFSCQLENTTYVFDEEDFQEKNDSNEYQQSEYFEQKKEPVFYLESESCYELDKSGYYAYNAPDEEDFQEENDPFEIKEFASAFAAYQGPTNTQEYPPLKKNCYLWTTERSLQKEDELTYYIKPWHALIPQPMEIQIDTFLNTCFNGYENKNFLQLYSFFQATPWLFNKIVNQTYPSPFFWAVINGNVFMTSKLLPHISLKNPFNKSALFYAVLLQRKKIVRLLLNHGIHPDTPATRYHPHLDLVFKAKSVKRFLKYQTKATWKTYAPLKAAILNNDAVMVKLLLSKGASNQDTVQSTKIPCNTNSHIFKLLKEKKLLKK